MGFLNELKNIWAKSQGALIAQNYMLGTNKGVIGIEAVTKSLSQNCMYKAWEKHPDAFNGKYGRPHKMVTALVGMVEILESGEYGELSRVGLLNAITHLYREIEVNVKFYPFRDIDFQLLNKMEPKITAEIEEFERKYGKLVDSILGSR